jgi:transcriptional/translational regulatory protein YebC/TACO1
MGSAGCVGYMFERKGLFSLPADAINEDDLLGLALDAGAEDVKLAGGSFEVICEPGAFNKVQEALQTKNLTPVVAEISQLAKTLVDLDAENARKLIRLVEAIDDHDDVQNVYHNGNMPDDVMAELAKD